MYKTHKIRSILLVALAIFAISAQANQTDAEKAFIQSVIPNTKFEKYEKSNELDGYYKIFLENGQLMYLNPFKKLIVFGEVWTTRGYSITQRDQQSWLAEVQDKEIEKLTADQLTKNALEMKFGKGKNKYDFVIFTDPECPFCKKAEEYFATKDVKLYINFLPLEMHPNAKEMSLQILSSKNPKDTASKIKKGEKVEVAITDKAKKQLDQMVALAEELNITGTPKIYVIDSKAKKVVGVINGARVDEIERYFSEGKK